MNHKFRSSEYIDFNTGTVICPPMVLMRRLKPPWSLEDKIRVFQCRVDVWQLGVAVDMLKQIESAPVQSSIWAHAAFGMLSVSFSYFEMIGKILNPESDKSTTSAQDFNWGFCDVYYPAYGESGLNASPEVKEFRNRVRNGIYHLALTKRGLRIHNNPALSTRDFDVKEHDNGSQTAKLYYVNPHAIVRTLVNRFPTFIQRLQDPSAGLRTKFLEYFDDFFVP